MEEKRQVLEECLKKLQTILQQHEETDWRKSTPRQILEVLGLQQGLEFMEETFNIHANICQNLTKDATVCLKHMQSRCLSNRDALKQCLSGAALCGTLLSGRKKDISEQRKQLVEIISEVEIKQCDQKPHTQFFEFDTLEKQREVENEILPKINSRKFSLKRFCESPDQTKSDEMNVKRAAAFFVVPVSQWEPKVSDLSLTGKAIRILQKIESLMISNSSKAKTICINFFESYGSHFQLNMIQLGGIFEIQIAYVERNNCQATEKRKEFIDRVLMTRHLCKLGYLDVGTVLKSNQDIKEFKLVSTRSYQYGGANPVVSYPLWKSTLSHCERSWTVVNKEKPENGDYVGVWTLIEHKCESFKNPKKLANFVAAVWTNLVNQNDDRDFCDLIEKWKESFLKKREAFANESKLPQLDDFLVLLQQLYEGESKFGYMPIQKTMIDCEKYLQPFLRKLMDMKFQGSEEKHQLWHGFLNLANKYGNCRREFVLEISTWLRKHVLSEFVVLPCPFHDIRSTSCAMEEIFLPVVTNILTQEICEEEAFFQFLTSTLQKAVSSALEKLLSSGNTQQYLAMFSNALTLGYDIKTKKIKETLTKRVIQEYSVRCKKSLMYMGAYTSDSSSINQARTFQSIIFQIINKGEKAAFFRDIIQTIIKMGLKLDESILNIVCGQTDTGLEIILKRILQISGISLTYFEGDKSEVYRPLYYEDLVFEHPSSVEQKPLFNILAKMNMTEFYPEKMSLQDVIKMHENQFTEPSSFAELPWAMLGKIIAINFDFREKVLHDLLQKLELQSHPEKKEENPKRQLISSRKAKRQTNEQYHPTDVFLALFQCLDPFLKRLVVQKMQLCQVAVPLVYWDYEQELFKFSLWPLREIFIDSGSESVATKQMQTLAFIRIGDKRKCSKSKLINQFLRGQNDEHSTFFHKDCLLGHCKRSFANGTIEASWYIPKSNTKNDDSRNPNEKEKTIEQPLTILNLRGDAFTFPEQLHFLTNFANALVLIIDYEDIESEKYLPVLAKVHASDAYVIIITSLPHDDNETEQFIQMYEEKTNLSYEKCSILSTTSEGRHLNEIEVKQFLINDIYDTLHHKITVSLEEISEQLPTDFCCDEELSKSLSGKQLCDEIISKIEGNQWKRELEKRDILPLQGEALWHEWSKEQKKERRSGKQEKINFNEPHLERMRILRMKQVCISEETSGTMAHFVEILLTLINDKQTALFFLSWLRQYMDSRSRIILPNILNSLREAFHKLELIRSEKGGENALENEKKLAQLKETISTEEKKLAHSSFGLEHFFREMGQLYEAFIYCKDDLSCTVTEKTKTVIYSLPLIAATLLCWGQPLEVMDGDAANVPLKWIDAVFSEVSKIIGENKRLFAISVLGIQSSGKSTLLNTMFGLQFAVSAGRCTRGIFIQLVPIDKKRSSLKFDYAMVIDTEGLRAPELATEKVNHDNELATLVIGLGDVAIINIKGETIADMEDVLQIVVHALIRLKQANEKINLKQSCVFVHQNVSAQDAEKMTIQGNQKIVSNLDKMTKEVAFEEHVANIESFQDVISFNSIKHVKYIPDLWHGTPPMAPASSQYSTSVTEVAKCILTDLTSDENHSYLSFENTRDHLRSLWNGILSENFVFSFRNVLEVKAYSLLEKKFQELTFQLGELKLKSVNDTLRPAIRLCRSCDELDLKEKTILKQFSITIATKTKALAEELEYFFKESELSEYMVHWKGKKDIELETTSDAIITDVRQTLSAEKEKCKAFMESNNRILENEQEIQRKATQFAKTLKGRQKIPSEEEITMTFNEAWKQWVDDIVQKNPESDVKDDINNMRSHIVDLLYNRYKKHEGLLKEGLKVQPVEAWGEFYVLMNSMMIEDINPKFISIHSTWGKVIEMVWREKCRKKAHQFINSIFIKVEMYVKNLEPDNEYDPTIFSQILRIVTDDFQAHYRDKKNEYTLTIPLEISVALHVARFSAYRFSKMIEAFKLKNSLRSRIESRRKETEALFVGICTAKANEVIVSNVFCLEMKPILQEKVERDLYLHIIRKISSIFEFTKYPLIKAILTDLAEKKDFEKFMQYITCCESYTQLWVTDYTKDHFRRVVENGKTQYTVFAMEVLRGMISEINRSVEKASSEPKSPLSVAEWIENFLFDLKQYNLNFSREPFHSIKNLGIKDFKGLSSVIKKNLDDIQKELNELFKKGDIEEVSWKDQSPYKVIMETLWGCSQTCPWCEEPCATTSRIDKHEHFCVQHRPQGVNGIHTEGSEELVLETCNYLIETSSTIECGDWCHCASKNSETYHPYKDYKKHIPTWDIKPAGEPSKYWCWFIGKYGKRLAELYDLTLPPVPEEWAKIKRKEAIASLSLD